MIKLRISCKIGPRFKGPDQMPYFKWAEPMQLNQLGSCEVRCLTQLSSTDFIWRSWGVVHAWTAVNNFWIEDKLWVKRRSSHESNQTHNQRFESVILTLPWETTAQLAAYEVKNNCWLFERRFKIQENGAFLFEISVFVLKILTFLYYGN